VTQLCLIAYRFVIHLYVCINQFNLARPTESRPFTLFAKQNLFRFIATTISTTRGRNGRHWQQ